MRTLMIPVTIIILMVAGAAAREGNMLLSIPLGMLGGLLVDLNWRTD